MIYLFSICDNTTKLFIFLFGRDGHLLFFIFYLGGDCQFFGGGGNLLFVSSCKGWPPIYFYLGGDGHLFVFLLGGGGNLFDFWGAKGLSPFCSLRWMATNELFYLGMNGNLCFSL